ncbi:serine/threonine protein kinase [bacterium]|nr:serine/threonine protein kinase [bacterium]
MPAQMFTCPSCFREQSFAEIEANNYACLNPECELSDRLLIHNEVNSSGKVTKIYGWLLEPGELFRGKYEIIRLLGKGGYGATYQAQQRDMQRGTFAIKETPRIYCDSEEDEFLLALNHPGIPKLFGRFNDGELHYIVMEFIQGDSLQNLAREWPQMGRMPLTLKLVEQICDVLDYIHTEGVIHRDLKPENILVRRNGSIAIIDFGIAKRFMPGVQTRHLARAASHFYSPPEQYDTGKGVTDPRTDIYSLGAILYFMLTGREPVDAINRRVDEPIQPLPRQLNPHITSAVENIIIKAMAMQAGDRFQSMAAMKKVLVKTGLYSARVCPHCGRLYRGNRAVCNDCGETTNPLGNAEAAPFVFRSGKKAATLQGFIAACYDDWDDAVWHLYQGDFEAWLNLIQEGAMADLAVNVQETIQNQNLGLNKFLMGSAFARPPKLDVSHDKIEFRNIIPGTQRRSVLTIYNPGKGYMQCELQISHPNLRADNYSFACFSGESRAITLLFSADDGNVPQNQKTNIVLKTNIGDKSIPVTISYETDTLKWRVQPGMLQFELLQNQVEVKGLSIEVQNSRGKLKGTVASADSWLHVQPIEFEGRCQLIRVEADAWGLLPGNYRSEIGIKTNIGYRKIGVRLNVKPARTRFQPRWRKALLPLDTAVKWFTHHLGFSLGIMLFFWLIYFTVPVMHGQKQNSWVILLFTCLGGAAGLVPYFQKRFNYRWAGVLVGGLVGLVAGTYWSQLNYPVYWVLELLIRRIWLPIFHIDPGAKIISGILLGLLGVWCGGLIEVIRLHKEEKLRPRLQYIGMLSLVGIFLAFIITLFAKIG